MSRITENIIRRNAIQLINRNRGFVDEASAKVSSGDRVTKPGDDPGVSGTISTLKETDSRFDQHKLRIANIKALLALQSDILVQANDLIIRGKEIASQAGNEVLGPDGRAQLSNEVVQLRDAMVQLANTTYKGKYIYSGARDNEPAFAPDDVAYAGDTSSGLFNQRIVFNDGIGTDVQKDVTLTDSVSVVVNTRGSDVFQNAIETLEVLARALAGHNTDLDANGSPIGTGVDFDFPADLQAQTQIILDSLTNLETARTEDVLNEQVSLAGRSTRAETAESILVSLQSNIQEVLTRTQGIDVFDAASELSRAQSALQSSLAVSAAVLDVSILDFL
ncbi:MAG: hypothetical protein H6619_06075 [Deltaproteobacteria bacterium]|nr:hypothetical protein [Deltaproteobacteria bacterium]